MSVSSLKSRLVFSTVVCMTILLIAFSLIIYQSISHMMFHEFDALLGSAAHMLAASVEQDHEEIGYEFDVNMVPEFATGKRSYYEFWGEDGAVIGKSPSLTGKEDLTTQFGNVSHWPLFKSFKMKDGQRVRAIAIKSMLRSEKNEPNSANARTITVLVAKDARRLFGQLRNLKYLLFFTSIGIIFVACGIAVIVVKQGLTPLNNVAAQIENIQDDNLNNRISGQHLPAEVVPIQRRLNNLLARLEASFERERAFNTDVAHELRTPLAGIRSIIDVTLIKVRSQTEYKSALGECLAITEKMQAMVDNLLTLARIESGQMKFSNQQIQAAALVNTCWSAFSDKAAGAKIIFENKIDTELIFHSDEAALSMIFSNLLANAVEYTNSGGFIRVSAGQKQNEAKIIFENTNNQLTDEQAAKVFECFWRGDPSRQSDIHCGLGLPLVKKIAESLGGKVSADLQNGVFSICLSFPL